MDIEEEIKAAWDEFIAKFEFAGESHKIVFRWAYLKACETASKNLALKADTKWPDLN